MPAAGEFAERLFKFLDRLPKDELLSVKDRSYSRARSSKGTRPPDYLTTPNSARRFIAQADSLLPESAGISSPKLTVWMRPPLTP